MLASSISSICKPQSAYLLTLKNGLELRVNFIPSWILLALILITGLVPSTHHAHAADHPNSITVAMDDNYPPYSFRDHDGQLQGILKDTWDLWATKTGIQVHILATDWGKAKKLIFSRKADVIDTISKNDERQKVLDFSHPYATMDVPIFFRKSISGISDVKNLGGFTVGVKDGDMIIDWLMEHGIRNFRKYPSAEALVLATKKDEIKVFVMGKPPAEYWLNKHNLESEFRYSASLFTAQFHWATLKGDDALHRLVAEGFNKITPEERRAIEIKWQGSPLDMPINDQLLRYFSLFGLAALGVALSLALLNGTLRRKVASKTRELTVTLEALRASKKYNRMLFEDSAVGLVLCGMNGKIADANSAFARIIGRSIEETLRLTREEITPSEYHEQDRKQLDALQETGAYADYVKELRDKTGRHVPVRISAALVDQAGEKFVLASVEDISQQLAAEEKINYLANHDTLTGLPNRLLLQDRLEQALAHAQRGGGKVALMCLDLDNFKAVNDSLGHACGDALIKAVAVRLLEAIRSTDTISRQGGDEFLIVLPALRDAEEAAEVMLKVMSSFQEPFNIESNELTASVSVGIAFYPDDGGDVEELLKHADIAMYQAKESGRNDYRFFDAKMHTEAVEQLNMSNGLRRALERKEMLLHYQPLHDLGSGAVIGAEALLRWNHPERGLIPPMQFIPFAEESGLIVPIGEWVLHEACRQMVQWHKAGAPNLVIAVNLSARQFQRADLEQSVISALELSSMDPSLLELELTESILISDTENVLNTVQCLKSLGVKLSIDDFGTGYSSLSYLKRFAVDKLKIDRSFVMDLTSDPDDAAIVRAIIQMAKNLGLKTIAEGVEDQATKERLRLFNCDQAQGYYFAKPMSADEFTAYLVERMCFRERGH